MPATADVSLPEQVDRYAEAVRGEIGVLDPLALDVCGSDHGSRTPRRVTPHWQKTMTQNARARC
jgi:hypothetical protein